MEKTQSLQDVLEKLKAPFPAGEERYRVGPTWEREGKSFTRPLAYIDARAVFDRLDEVVGPDHWETHLERLAPGVFLCRMTVLGVTRSDVGMAGENESEKDKSGASDAIKRVAVQFGIARYLYQKDLPVVALERGNLPSGWNPTETKKPVAFLRVAEAKAEPEGEKEPVTERQMAKIGALWSQVFGNVLKDQAAQQAAKDHLEQNTGKSNRKELSKQEAMHYIDCLLKQA
ncbi:MAG: Rad52/Rad22 family DNA repair protein [Bacteroidota bacterium]